MRLPRFTGDDIKGRGLEYKSYAESRLVLDFTPVLLIDSLCYNESAPVTAGTLKV